MIHEDRVGEASARAALAEAYICFGSCLNF